MKFRLLHLLIFSALIAVVVALPQLYLRVPGTLYFDTSGRPHGTGLKQHFYDSGALMIDEYYKVSEMTRSVWYHPDKAVLADVTIPDKTKTFIGLYVNQNGTIRKKMTYRFKDGDYGWLAESRRSLTDEDRR